MMRRAALFVVLCALAAAGPGCATPRSHFYDLAPSSAAAPAPAGYFVAVGPVSVPQIVDRPQVVVRTGPNRVFIDEFHRWGAPLQDEIARVVAANLASLLGTPRVTAHPGAPPAGGGYRVLVEVLDFDSAPGESAGLDAVWTVRGARPGAVRSGRTTVREAAQGEGYAALAAAHSRALGKMSGDIADAIRALEGG